MHSYTAPQVSRLGSLADLTQSVITKSAGSGDVIVINGQSTSVPGGGVIGVS
jgi:hypothetical protein